MHFCEIDLYFHPANLESWHPELPRMKSCQSSHCDDTDLFEKHNDAT